MSSERLATLLRQRQLLTGHLAWLDAEIAAASGPTADASPATPGPAASQPATPVPPSAPPVLPAQPVSAAPIPAGPPSLAPSSENAGKLKEADPEALARANALADNLLQKYQATEKNGPKEARRSCLLLTIAFGLFCVAGLMGIYLYYNR